jgi:hypothetical protein
VNSDLKAILIKKIVQKKNLKISKKFKKIYSKMKLIFSSLLVGFAIADHEQMKHDFKQRMESLDGERSITNTDMDMIDEYGCWCYFMNDHGQGRGKPVDDIDMLCKRLHDGYTCAIMDALDLGMTCVPWEVQYNSALGSGLGMGMNIDGIRTECNSQNQATGCEQWACKIEGYFVQQLVLLFTHGGEIHDEYSHSNGFDWRVDCPISTGIQSEKACCDEHPIRFPFKTYNGARDCCYSHTFNTNLYQCCPDGHVKMSC